MKPARYLRRVYNWHDHYELERGRAARRLLARIAADAAASRLEAERLFYGIRRASQDRIREAEL